jgi:hypothetical protein
MMIADRLGANLSFSIDLSPGARYSVFGGRDIVTAILDRCCCAIPGNSYRQ